MHMWLVRTSLCLLLSATQAAVADPSPPPSPFEQAITRGQYKAADQLAADGLKALPRQPDFKSEDIVRRHLQAARSAAIWARWSEAIRLLIVVDSGMRNTVAESSPLWIELHAEQIAVQRRVADYARADHAYREARQRVAKHPQLGASSAFINLLAEQVNSLTAQQRNWDAIVVLEERLAWLKKNDASNTLQIGGTLSELGELNQALGRIQTSEALLRQAETVLEPIYRRATAPRRSTVGVVTDWAVAAYRVRDYAKWDACKLREELISTVQQELGADNTELIHPLVDAARMCEEEIRASAREKMFDRALKIATDSWGASHPDVLHVLEQQGIYFASREYSTAMNDKGDSILAKALQLRRQVYADAPSVLAVTALYDLANNRPDSYTAFATGQCKAQVLAGIERLASAWGDKHPALALMRAYVITRLGGFSSTAASDRDDAARHAFVEEQCGIAFDAAVAGMGSDHPQTGQIAGQCGEFLVSVRKYKAAERLYAHAATVFSKHFGESESATREAKNEQDRMRLMIEKR